MIMQVLPKRIVLFVTLLLVTTFSYAYDLVVAADGSGNYTTVQAAINAAPNNSTLPYTIFIKNGKYREKITIPSTKTYIQLIGESVTNTFVYYDDPATVLGTQNSASFTVNANDFTAVNITFANTYGDGSQAVAVLLNADRAVFKNCRLMANQDTLYTKGSGTPRHYFYKCYIDGNIDFIFGSSVAVFDSCVIYAKSRTTAGSSYITAANTPSGQTYGYVFRDCFLPANTGATTYFLGRPWGNGTSGTSSYNKTVFITSTMTNSVSAAGWSTWDGGTITSQITYAEYKSKSVNGGLVDVSSRVAWSKQFTDADTVGYNLPNMFSNWSPASLLGTVYDYVPEPIAVSNFRGVKGSVSSQFDWNISWPKAGIVYTLYRSNDNVNFSPVYTTTSVNDTAVNFKYVDASLPGPGNKYYYYLSASKSGFDTHNTDTVVISSKQTISSSVSTISAFLQQLGTPTDSKSYTVSGINLTGDITITAPANFEISNDNGTSWHDNSSPLVLTQTSGVVSATSILVRLSAAANGTYSGNILHTSDNADNVNVAVSGTTQAVVLIPTTLIHWPMSPTLQNSDSALARSAAIEPNTTVLKNIALADGSIAAVTSYTALYGQAFNNGIAGTGLWTTGNGGTGSNLSRIHYQEFKVKANSTSSVRVDSLIANFNFYGAAGTTSNFGYRFACVWSKSGFTADSSNVTGVDSSGVTGISVTSAKTGGFTDYLLINTKSDGVGPISRFAFILNGTNGVTLNPGDSLVIRLYSCTGSGSTGRYGTLKNVMAKGVVLSGVPVRLISFTGGNTAGTTKLWWNVASGSTVKNYAVEFSSNGNSFSTVGVVGATSAKSYQYTETRSISGVGFYRLKLTDESGKVTYSNVIKINIRNNNFNLNLYPNPVKQQLTASYPVVAKPASIRIYTVEGKMVYTQQLQQGSSVTTIDVNRLSKGSYQVVYQEGEERIVRKVVKD